MCPSTPPMTGRKKSDIILERERRVIGSWATDCDKDTEAGGDSMKKTDKPIHPKHPLTSYKIKLTLWTIVSFSFPSFPFHHSFHFSTLPSLASAELFQMVMSI